MIVCSCRYISIKDYKTYKELVKRLREYDSQCASCITRDSLQYLETLYNQRKQNGSTNQ